MCLVDPVSNRGDIRKSIGAHKIDGSRMLWGAMECRSLIKAGDCREDVNNVLDIGPYYYVIFASPVVSTPD